MEPDHSILLCFKSESDVIFLKDKMDHCVESLANSHDHNLSEFRVVLPNTQAYFAARQCMVEQELQGNNKAIQTEVKCKDNPEAHAQNERLDLVKILDVDFTAAKPTTIISQSKVEECPESQTDDLKEPIATMKEDFRSNPTREIPNCTKRRVLEEEEPRQKLEKTKKRKLLEASNHPFTAKAVANGQTAEVQPQEVWLNASPYYSMYRGYSCTRVSVVYSADS